MRDMMNTKEVAEYLRIKERKVYDLISSREIPCSRVGGKWIFPKALIDQWIVGNLQSEAARALVRRPGVVVGSHDPLLDWAVRESGCDLAAIYSGSSDGLRRFAAGEATLCGCHILDRESGSYNVPTVRKMLPQSSLVVIHWAVREQGLIVAPGNPLAIQRLHDLQRTGARVVGRQPGAGSQILLQLLCERDEVAVERLNLQENPARNESDVATAIVNGRADAGVGIASVAAQHGLGFVFLQRERFDLVMDRRDYFSEPLQRLWKFARSQVFTERAQELRGYQLDAHGEVVFNGI